MGRLVVVVVVVVDVVVRLVVVVVVVVVGRGGGRDVIGARVLVAVLASLLELSSVKTVFVLFHLTYIFLKVCGSLTTNLAFIA